jgi:energy-coupling factor transporter ATP-binding protein EcfA2
MACWLSEEEKEAIRRSKLIDRQLQQEKKNLRQEIKILLLGAGESGKSTFIKQMRIIHGEDYSEQDRLEFRATIYHNILKSMKILVEARRRLQIPLENPKNEENGHKVSTYHRDGELTDEEFHPYVDPLNALWKDAGIKATVKRNNEFQLVSLKYEAYQFILGCLPHVHFGCGKTGCCHKCVYIH